MKYQVLVEMEDTELTVTVETDADLSNCDEDMFLSAIEFQLEELGFDVDLIDHFEVVQ